MALFRYGIIAPLVERDTLPPGTVTQLVTEATAQTYHFPGAGPVTVSPRTFYHWLKCYREGGIAALRPCWRKDRGQSRVLDQAVLQRAVELRQEQPERWTTTLLDILRLEGQFQDRPRPHRATLDRHLATRGASRRQLRVLGTRRTIKMVFAAFGDLWVGDYHHGPLVLSPDHKPTTAKLGAFIDHCTRYPVAHRYYLAEDLASLRDTLLRALLTWGPPKRGYVDRGAVYRSDQLAYSLEQVHCHLIHSRAYYSQGRGVIERWWQIADQFEAEVRALDHLLTLHELNRRWEAFVELRYCQVRHSEIEKTPAEAIAGVVPHPIDPEVARELFLVREDRKVNPKTACVSVVGREFLCESFLRDQKVQVRYDPADFTSVLIFRNGERVQRALPRPINATPEPHPDPGPQPAAKARQSVDYLALLRDDFDRKLLEQARPLAYAQLVCEPAFDVEHFIEIFKQFAGLTLRPSVRRELQTFWEAFGPLPESLVRIGVEHAVRLHGRGLNLQVYLHAVRTLVLAHLRHPDPAPQEKKT